MSWITLVLVSSSLLLLYMIWQERKRVNSSRLPWRLVAAVCAVASFACIALPLSIRRQAAGDNSQAVLLTEGYNKDSVLHFLRQFEKQPDVYAATGAQQLPASINPVLPYYPDSLNSLIAKYTPLHVFGTGFSGADTSYLKNGSFVFHPSLQPAGIQSIHWLNRLRTGEHLIIQGSCYNPLTSPIKLLLKGLQAHLDSTIIPPNTTGLFALQTVPKFAGKALYSITVTSVKDTLELNPVPVLVDTAATIKILMLGSSPDFENKFLKNWLAKHQYEVDLRTVITTRKYNTLLVNTENKSLNQINASMLKRYDLLISDPASLAGLNSSELQAITQLVARNGTGLIVRADSLLPRSFYGGYFPLAQTTDSLPEQVNLYINDAVADTVRWTATQPLYIRPHPATQPLIHTSRAATIASSALYGSGKIVLTTLNNSYSWLLAGNEAMYASFWSLLINKSLKKQPENDTWSTPLLPRIHEPATVNLESDLAGVPQHTITNTTVAWQQHATLPFQWQATYWPLEGWQTAGSDNQPFSWFVFGDKNWRSIQAYEHLLTTKNYVSRHTAFDEKSGQKPVMISVPIPKIYFFIIFIISIGYLWIEKKFR